MYRGPSDVKFWPLSTCHRDAAAECLSHRIPLRVTSQPWWKHSNDGWFRMRWSTTARAHTRTRSQWTRSQACSWIWGWIFRGQNIGSAFSRSRRFGARLATVNVALISINKRRKLRINCNVILSLRVDSACDAYKYYYYYVFRTRSTFNVTLWRRCIE